MPLAAAPLPEGFDGDLSSSAAVPDNSTMFAFPQQVVMCDVPEESSVFHAFALTDASGQRLYGHCCTRYFPLSPDLVRVARMQVGFEVMQLGERISPESAREKLDRSASAFEPMCLCIFTEKPLFQSMRNVLAAFVFSLDGGVHLTAAHVARLYKLLGVGVSILHQPLPALRRDDRRRGGAGGAASGESSARPERLCISGRTVVAHPPHAHAWELPVSPWTCLACRNRHPARTATTAAWEDDSVGAARCFHCKQCSHCVETLWGVPQTELPDEYRVPTKCHLALPELDVDCEPLFRTLSPPTVIAAITALMLERQVVAVSNSISPLTDVLGALVALMFPLEWPHSFIPVLPSLLSEVLQAPVPFLIGVPRSALIREVLSDGSVRYLDVPDSVAVLDLDDDSITDNFAPPDARLPLRLTIRLYDTIQRYANVHERRRSVGNVVELLTPVSAPVVSGILDTDVEESTSPRGERGEREAAADGGAGGAEHTAMPPSPVLAQLPSTPGAMTSKPYRVGPGEAHPAAAAGLSDEEKADDPLSVATDDGASDAAVDGGLPPGLPPPPAGPMLEESSSGGAGGDAATRAHAAAVQAEVDRRLDSLGRRKGWLYRGKLKISDGVEAAVAMSNLVRGRQAPHASLRTLDLLNSDEEDSDEESRLGDIVPVPWQGRAYPTAEFEAFESSLRARFLRDDSEAAHDGVRAGHGDAAVFGGFRPRAAVVNVARLRRGFLNVMVSLLKAFRQYLHLPGTGSFDLAGTVAEVDEDGHGDDDGPPPDEDDAVAREGIEMLARTRFPSGPLNPAELRIGDGEAVFCIEEFAAEQASYDSDGFVRALCGTNLFELFLQDRIHHDPRVRSVSEVGIPEQARRTDIFDRACYERMQARAWRHERLSRENYEGVMHKAKTNTRRKWERRFFELNGNRLSYYSDWRRLQNLKHLVQTATTVLKGLRPGSEKHVEVSKDLKETRAALQKLKEVSLRRTIELTPGETRVLLPSAHEGAVFKTPYAIEIVHEGRVLTVCTESSSARAEWIMLIKSRLRTDRDRTRMRQLYLDREVDATRVRLTRDLRQRSNMRVTRLLEGLLSS